MNTSVTTTELGLYVSGCCQQELIFDEGDSFCRCPACNNITGWILQEPLVRVEDFAEWELEDAVESKIVVA